jgi:acyl carrier protein
MTKDRALRLLEENQQRAPNSLTGGEALEDLGWDSLSVVEFIAMADRDFGLTLEGNQVAKCRSVAELLQLLGVTPS